MKKLFVLYLLTFLTLNSFASSIQSGAITWEYVSSFAYKIRITTLSQIGSPGGNEDRCKLTLHINNADSIVLLRINGLNTFPTGDCVGTFDGIDISFTSKVNIYEGIYTFPCVGKFRLSCNDPNRIGGVVNIPNSVNFPFFIESEIVVPFPNYQCPKNSISIQPNYHQISNTPNQRFYPYTINTNGDSLDYSLIPSQYNSGQNIPGYSSSGFTVNNLTGEITSNATIAGDYYLCLKTKIFRNQEYIGSINCDQQVKVTSSFGTNLDFNGFNSNLSQINGIYQLGASQTFTFGGSSTNSTNANYLLFSEITGSTTPINYSSTNFSFSITYSANLARNEPYEFVLSARNTSVMSLWKDTLVRIKFLGGATNTCGLMGITNTPCALSVKENVFDKNEINIYPSVTSDILHVSGIEPKKVFIIDLSGKKIETTISKDNNVSVGNLADGLYILSLIDSNNQNHYYKFVKR